MSGQPRSAVLLAVLTAGITPYGLLQTMVVPALPAFQRELGASTTWTTWVLTSFLVTASVATPILGRLGDQYGRRRLLLATLVVFLVGCVGATLAWDIWSLIAFRAVQGVGGAMYPLAFAVVRDQLPRDRVGFGLGVISGTAGVGGGLGLILSGLIVDHLSWRWIFAASAIAVGIALVLTWLVVPHSQRQPRTRPDMAGAGLLAAGLVCLLLALTEAQAWGWASARILGLFAAAAVVFGLWWRVELRVAAPLVDMRMLGRRPVLLTNLVALVAGFGMFATFVPVPLLAEVPRGLEPEVARLVDYGFGASATVTGLLILPASISIVIAGPLAGALGQRLRARSLIAVGLALMAVGTGALALFHDEPWQVLLTMVPWGTGMGFVLALMPRVITDAVEIEQTGVATGINSVMRTVGQVIGGQVVAAILAGTLLAGTEVPAESGFVAAFWASTGATLVALVVALGLPRHRAPRAVVSARA
ncbi:MAG: MFS transporter [Thermoleophilia bacterium]